MAICNIWRLTATAPQELVSLGATVISANAQPVKLEMWIPRFQTALHVYVDRSWDIVFSGKRKKQEKKCLQATQDWLKARGFLRLNISDPFPEFTDGLYVDLTGLRQQPFRP